MKPITLLIARRYVAGSRHEKNISLIMIICFIGICIGSCALALITSIMNGFEQVTYERMQSVHPQITISSNNGTLNVPEITRVIAQKFPAVVATSASTLKQVIIQHDYSTHEVQTTIALIKGIQPATENVVSTIETKIVHPAHAKLAALLQKNDVLIGEKLAQQLDITLGDSLTLMFSEGEQVRGNKIILNSTQVKVAGIFSIGIDEFDNNFLFCSLEFLESIFPDAGITSLSLKLKPHTNEESFILELRKQLNLDVFSWQSLYPALVAALKLDKYVSFFVLALITLVASMNVISLLFMMIIQKRVDIAILRAMGMGRGAINQIFFTIGLGLTTVACATGLLLAFIIGLLLDKYPFITLPDAYLVTQLPIRMEWYIFSAVFCMVVLLGVCATYIAIRRTKKFNIAHILRFEG